MVFFHFTRYHFATFCRFVFFLMYHNQVTCGEANEETEKRGAQTKPCVCVCARASKLIKPLSGYVEKKVGFALKLIRKCEFHTCVCVCVGGCANKLLVVIDKMLNMQLKSWAKQFSVELI